MLKCKSDYQYYSVIVDIAFEEDEVRIDLKLYFCIGFGTGRILSLLTPHKKQKMSVQSEVPFVVFKMTEELFQWQNV